MKTIITLDKANQPYGYPQLDGSGNLIITGSVEITGSLKQNGYEVKPYKVYTALLTQNGGDDELSNNYGNLAPLVIGASYYINNNLPLIDGGTDFTNVGATNNEIGTWFVATGTSPIWGTSGGDVTSNGGAPVVTVLENTIGNIWWTYSIDGTYLAQSDALFLPNKTFFTTGPANSGDLPAQNTSEYLYNTDSIISILTFYDGGRINSRLLNTPFEIRVYN